MGDDEPVIWKPLVVLMLEVISMFPPAPPLVGPSGPVCGSAADEPEPPGGVPAPPFTLIDCLTTTALFGPGACRAMFPPLPPVNMMDGWMVGVIAEALRALAPASTEIPPVRLVTDMVPPPRPLAGSPPTTPLAS